MENPSSSRRWPTAGQSGSAGNAGGGRKVSLGFVAGEIATRDDFDRMGERDVEERFGVGD